MTIGQKAIVTNWLLAVVLLAGAVNTVRPEPAPAGQVTGDNTGPGLQHNK